MSSKKYTLTICFPTYNRAAKLLPNIKKYLVYDEDRVSFTIQDNCSTDGSYEQFLSIHNERLTVRQNLSNIGALPNAKCALANNPNSEYVMFSIDKDMFDMPYLSKFIDYLEKEKPACGCLEVYGNPNEHVDTFSAGKEAVIHTGYLNKHPTGYFWRCDLLYAEMAKPYFKGLPEKFDFWFDVVMAHIAAMHPTVWVYIPAIFHGPRQPGFKPTKTITYNESNYFFSCSKRLETFEIYVKDLLSLNLPKQERQEIALLIARDTVSNVTTGLRHIYTSGREVYHYNLTWRIIPWHEMFGNAYKVLRIYLRLLKGFDSNRVAKGFYIWFRNIAAITKLCLEQLIHKPQNIPYHVD